MRLILIIVIQIKTITQHNTMSAIVALATSGNLPGVATLIEQSGYWLFGDAEDGPNGFDILIQHAVDRNFSKKRELTKLLKLHGDYYYLNIVNLVEEFLKSPLAARINIQHGNDATPFFVKVKNVIKLLHDVDKSQVSWNLLFTTFIDAFSAVPKDAISLIKYMIDNNILCGLSPEEIGIILVTSPRVFGWVLNSINVCDCSAEIYETIFYTLFTKVIDDKYVLTNLDKYVGKFINYINVYSNDVTIIKAYNKAIWAALSESYTTRTDINKFANLIYLVTTFYKALGYEVFSLVAFDVIILTTDPLVKLWLTRCFRIFGSTYFTESEQTELFQDFLLSLEYVDVSLRKTFVSKFVMSFPYLENTFCKDWDTNNDNGYDYYDNGCDYCEKCEKCDSCDCNECDGYEECCEDDNVNNHNLDTIQHCNSEPWDESYELEPDIKLVHSSNYDESITVESESNSDSDLDSGSECSEMSPPKYSYE